MHHRCNAPAWQIPSDATRRATGWARRPTSVRDAAGCSIPLPAACGAWSG